MLKASGESLQICWEKREHRENKITSQDFFMTIPHGDRAVHEFINSPQKVLPSNPEVM